MEQIKRLFVEYCGCCIGWRELVTKLASLGFTVDAAITMLLQSDAEFCKTYGIK
jgi:hypothetical protein